MKKILILLLALMMQNIVLPMDLPENELPYNIKNYKVVPLRNLIDNDLQAALIKKLNENKTWARLIKSKKMAVGVVDISDPNNVKFARVNGNEMMYAASLPKLAVLLASMDAIEKGELEETDEVKKDMTAMIRFSDNRASTRMIDRVGFDKIEEVLTDPRYEFYDEDFGGGLWVGKRYASGGDRHPDPMRGLSHAATVSQVCRYYYLLAFGKLVSFEKSKQMFEILSNPKIQHKFVKVMREIAPLAKLFRKSGTWKNWHSDSMIVWGPNWRRYILVALIEDSRGEKILRNLVPAVEEILDHK
jgi:beta-lactamase class A